MIGNDIVDLQLAAVQSDWRRRGFLDKLYTQHEQELISNAKHPFKMVWRLWSMKESAYKAFLRNDAKRFFNPRKIMCTIRDKELGIVTINKIKYQTRSEITGTVIHTVALEQKEVSCISQLMSTKAQGTKDLSAELKKTLVKQIAAIKSIEPLDLEVKKDTAGRPHCFQGNKQLNITFSLSHHGNYGAYVILN